MCHWWPIGLTLLLALLQLHYISILRVMASVGALDASVICSKIPGLAPAQRSMCQAEPDAMVAVGDGALMAIKECQNQFRNRRWNCTPIEHDSVFGHVVVVGSREAAYIYALTAAGVAHAVTQACRRGNISSCGCDHSVDGLVSLVDGWKWGGCSANVKYGVKYAKRFVDAREIEGDDRSLMNLHNNRAGRKAVKDNLVTECKCHGVSGSCSMKTCWKSLPQFNQIATYLMNKYHTAKEVQVIELGKNRDRRPLALKLKRSKRPHRKPRKRDLVYLHQSPNYCEMDKSRGSLGTGGRKCNRTSTGADGCDLLCCGRGYNTHQLTRTWQCQCKFHWCCYVKCNLCTERGEEYTCK
ncbi:hypothetical protein CHUAL_005008 [Chamberlinius hualienensis]